jgi:hypothetical protein
MTFDMHRRNFLAGATVVAVPLLPSSSQAQRGVSTVAVRTGLSRFIRPLV